MIKLCFFEQPLAWVGLLKLHLKQLSTYNLKLFTFTLFHKVNTSVRHTMHGLIPPLFKLRSMCKFMGLIFFNLLSLT